MAEQRTIPEIEQWLTRVCFQEKPSDLPTAYNIGLFETPDGYSAYLIGAEYYDDANGDWACKEAFSPAERYCPISETVFSNWRDAHAAAAQTVRDFLLSSPGKNSFLGSAKAVTVGFDDGDLERVS